jgi:hypothetical protein
LKLHVISSKNGTYLGTSCLISIEGCWRFLQPSFSAKSNKSTLILPDKDADGLSSGCILHHTLTKLGLSESLISLFFPPKGTNIHEEPTRIAISELSPEYIFVLDQGSRKGPALTDAPHKCLIIDHHFVEEGGFPDGCKYVTAHDCPPVATSSLLTYLICLPLHPDIKDKTSWIAALGTHGDLGNRLQWKPPFPDMTETFEKHSRSSITLAVARINAPRRSIAYDVRSAWDALLTASGPDSILVNERLLEARAEVARETERCTHTAPKFSLDATIAILLISSPAQVHPEIAKRWSGNFKSGRIEIVMCANEGYVPGKVHFSCRIAKAAAGRTGEDKVDIIKKLKSIVAADPDLAERIGDNYAKGHKEASGGVVAKEEWEELVKLMGMQQGGKRKSEDSKNGKSPTQKNVLTNYFKATK